MDFGTETNRLNELCEQFGVSKERVYNSFVYLKSQKRYINQPDIVIADCLECQIKMLSFGAVKKLSGEQ